MVKIWHNGLFIFYLNCIRAMIPWGATTITCNMWAALKTTLAWNHNLSDASVKSTSCGAYVLATESSVDKILLMHGKINSFWVNNLEIKPVPYNNFAYSLYCSSLKMTNLVAIFQGDNYHRRSNTRFMIECIVNVSGIKWQVVSKGH